MFLSTEVVLVQFRQSIEEPIPVGVRYRGTESEAERNRRTDLQSRDPFALLLERNGASLEMLSATLTKAGFVLADAHVQKRMKRGANGDRLFLLLTYVFRHGSPLRADLYPAFEGLASRRYGYVTVSRKEGANPLCAVVAKTPANAAVKLRVVSDDAAAAWGITVSKSVPKSQREATEPKETSTIAHFTPAKKAVSAMSGGSLKQQFTAAGWRVRSRE